MSIATELSSPAQPRGDQDRLKLHLRLITIGRHTYRILTLRPVSKFAFSTNFFHQTWHIVTSQRGSRLLARLLWGLSYARHPGTLLLIHGEHLLPTPFEAERSDPILLIPAGLTQLDAASLRILKGRLNRLGPPTVTTRLHTFGMDRALLDSSAGPSQTAIENEWLRWKENRGMWRQERMRRLGGFICYSAPPAIMRLQALRIHALRVRSGNPVAEMDYHFIAEASKSGSWADGEIQIFADYMDRVHAAVEARTELVANPNQPVISETVQETISRRRDRIKARRKRHRQKSIVEECDG